MDDGDVDSMDDGVVFVDVPAGHVEEGLMDGAVHGRGAEAADLGHVAQAVEIDAGGLLPDPLLTRPGDGASQVAAEGAGAAGVGG